MSDSSSYYLICPQHRKEHVLYTCTHTQCNRLPLMCPACPDSHSDHQSSVISFSEWVKAQSKNVESAQQQQSFLTDQLTKYKQLLKWCEDDEMHLRKVEEHCRAQKALIAEDICEARELFNEMCKEVQAKLDNQLEEFSKAYKECFKQCKSTVDESFSIYKKFAPFINPNNLMQKLQQSNYRESVDLTQGLKRMSVKVQALKSDRKSFVDSLIVVSEKLTDLTYNLPVYQFSQGLDIMCRQLADTFHQHLKSKLSVPIITIPNNNAPSSPQRLDKENGYQYQSKQQNIQPNRSLPVFQKSPQKIQHQPSQIQTQNTLNTILSNNKTLLIGTPNLTAKDAALKPLKKYQLDFLVSGVEVVSETLFALSCSTDPYLRVFDTVQKRIHTLQAHSNPIQFLCKWSEGSQNQPQQSPLLPNYILMNQGKTPKTPFLFTLSTDAVIVWTFDNGQISIPHIYHKYNFNQVCTITAISPLYDGSCLMLGDLEGGIEVYNYQTQKIQQAQLRGKHSKQITTIQVLRKFDKAVVGAQDANISVWRLNYNNLSNTATPNFESAYCEHVFSIGRGGGISCLSLLSMTPNLVIAFTTDGQMKVVDLQNWKIILENEERKQQNGIIDYLVAEDKNRDHICVMALQQSSKSVRIWKLQPKDDQQWNQYEGKVDFAISANETQIPATKMQIVHMLQNSQNPLVLVSNELNKELLVYEIISK